MTKKEFKKKCKAEKTKSYQYTLAGVTLVIVGFIVTMVVMLLDRIRYNKLRKLERA